jgi:hydrogenase expression/formation protein HypE
LEDIITLDYGSGGKKTSALIEDTIVPRLRNDALAALGDGAVLDGAEKLVFSTDSFVVSPYFFPGGDIGKLSVCGTVNDISMAGGEPRYLSLALIIEEGLPASDLERIMDSVAQAAGKAGVQVVTGDTKVVERGRGDGIYINTAGIGVLRHPGLSPSRIREGDAVLVSGTVGDHGAAVMLARNSDLAEGELLSDCAPLNGLAEALRPLGDDLRVLRDPTRGGVATTLCEFVEGSRLCIELQEKDIPVKEGVESVCDMLGLDPLYCANEGKLLAVVAPDRAQEALSLLRSREEGRDAAVIGKVISGHPGMVVVRTPFGGSRMVAKLAGAQLPRIC